MNLLLLLCLFAAAEPLGGLTVTALLHAAPANNTLVDSGLDAVVHLDVKLRHLVVLVHAGIHDIAHGRGVDHVADDKALDGLVLRDGLRRGGAADNFTGPGAGGAVARGYGV